MYPQPRPTAVGPESAQVVASALKTNASLTTLNMERNGLGWKGGKALGEALATNSTLTRLDLSLNDIGPEGGLAFGLALKTNTSLTGLVMVRCGLGPDGGRALGEALECTVSLTHLDLTQNDLGASGGIAIGRALATNTSLTSLNYRLNRIGFGMERSIGVFARALAANTSLRWLDMAQNELGAIGGHAFGEMLQANRTLEVLSLERNELGEEGGRAVANAMASNASLKSLNVSDNELGAAGGAFAQALSVSRALTALDASKNGLGPDAGSDLGAALKQRPSAWHCLSLDLSRNHLQGGAVCIADALAVCPTVTALDLSGNLLGVEFGTALARGLCQNTTLRSLKLARNHLEDGTALGEVLAMHPALTEVDLSQNLITTIQLESQLRLGRSSLRLDMSGNPLSSPPLGVRGSVDELQAYFRLMASESTRVTRIRLMILGFGGVGKTTFSEAATRELDEMADFQSSLTPLHEWDSAMLTSWARCLRTEWSSAAAAVLESLGVQGKDVQTLVVQAEQDFEPSVALDDKARPTMNALQRKQLARAIGSLCRKGYFSTVGAVKVEGLIPLHAADGSVRECSLVDFAGQMEYLVSHQLLLTTMHALCLVIKPAPSFASPTVGASRRHHESWSYWLRYLRALSERPTGSLLLAVSQLDKLSGEEAPRTEGIFLDEFEQLRRELGNELGDAPLRLDYSPRAAESSMRTVRERLSEAVEAVAQNWWVPQSYEQLAGMVRRLGREMKTLRQLPILSTDRLRQELREEAGLRSLCDDPQLLKRGLDYLQAVGDVMTDDRLDCLLLDPVGWFASFLAHFIRDDGNRPAEVVRGVVSLEDVVVALRHEYANPEEQVPAVLALVCKLELCLPHAEAAPEAPAFLFPCLLPSAAPGDIARHWPSAGAAPAAAAAAPVIRGHRFRAALGFLPPGLFPGLVARLRLLNGRLPRGSPDDCVHSQRLWNDAAVLVFREARVLLRVDLASATLDVVVAAPADEWHFVGAAKGQASLGRWMAHLIRQFLWHSYKQIVFNEAWLCPSAKCHGLELTRADPPASFGVYSGKEFPLKAIKRKASGHVCEQEGCWHQLGVGHKLEPMALQDGQQQVCGSCQREAYFPLRAGSQFGWGNKADAQLMLAGIGLTQAKPGCSACE